MTDSAPLDADAIVGCLLGQAVGDMMGLPAENLSPRRTARLFPNLDRPRFLFGYGVGSDDTEHAFMTAQALLRSGGDAIRFRESLAWRLRGWFACGPPGIGLATLKACLRLWAGVPSTRSGVYSAGNGSAMRAAVLGAAIPSELALAPWVHASTVLTHTDPQAAAGAFMVASVAREAALRRGGDFDAADFVRMFVKESPQHLKQSHLIQNLESMSEAHAEGQTVAEFAARLRLDRGVTGYIAHTVPVAVYAFIRHRNDYRAAVETVIRCGGDTDTVAAITGALVGTWLGKAGIPDEWLSRFADWPLAGSKLEEAARRLAEGNWCQDPQQTVRTAWWAYPFRNLLFFLIVLAHLFRRILPPY